MKTRALRITASLLLSGLVLVIGWVHTVASVGTAPRKAAESSGREAPSVPPQGEAEASEAANQGHHFVKVLPPCGAVKRAEVLAPATVRSFKVGLDCQLTLAPTDRITKRVIIQGSSGSGVRLDCQGATIDGRFIHLLEEGRDTVQIRSEKVGDSWKPATDVTIRNCRIIGSIRAFAGLSLDELRAESRRVDFVERIRAAAPHRILLTNLHITAIGRIPLYVHVGASHVRLTDSTLDGQASGGGVYLDHESTGNVLKGNDFRVTSEAEEISLDGSSYNEIISNTLSTLNTGGIWLFRNCGERSVVRHTWARSNLILNNVFIYHEYSGPNPAVFLGSRSQYEDYNDYCADDDDSSLGSGADDRSNARYNVVMQNRILNRAVSEMIRIGTDGSNIGNYIAIFDAPGYNETVSSAPPRAAGCYTAKGYKRFFANGEAMDVYIKDGEPVCGGERTCGDGEWSAPTSSDCSIRKVADECFRTGNDAGCAELVGCPGPERIVGAYAACNLEGTTIGNGELYGINSVPLNTFSVLRPSDNPADGWCQVGNRGIHTGNAPIDGVLGHPSFVISCREHDQNGGDCKVRAIFYCR
jgi:hypothetical protein